MHGGISDCNAVCYQPPACGPVKPLHILMLTMFIDLAGFAMFIPLLNYIVAELGGSILTVGLLITAFSLAQFACLPAWGRLSDRIGRRPVIMLGLGGAAVAYAVFGLADPALGLSDDRRLLLGVLFLSRIMLGVMSANYAAAYAYVADVTPPEERAQGMGMLGVAFGLGFVCGPVLGGLLGQWGFWLPAFFGSGLALLNLYCAWRWLPESLPPDHVVRPRVSPGEALRETLAYLRQPRLGLLLVIFTLYLLAFSIIFGTFVEFSKERIGLPVRLSGVLFAYMGGVSIVTQGGLVGPAVRRCGEAWTSRVGALLMLFGMGYIPYTTTIEGVALATTIFSLGSGFIQPTLNALISRAVGPQEQGTVLGLSQSLGALSRAIGPLLGTSLWTLLGYAAPFRLASLTFALVLVLMLQVGQSRRAVVQQSALLFAGFSLALWAISPSPGLDRLALVAATAALLGALLMRKQ